MDTELQVTVSDFNGEQVQAVSAKTLYQFLGLSKKNFAGWLVQSIVNNEYALEGEDYIIVTEGVGVKDCILTIDFAKRLAMKSGGGKAEEVRAYFLNVEKAYDEKAVELNLHRIAKFSKMLTSSKGFNYKYL